MNLVNKSNEITFNNLDKMESKYFKGTIRDLIVSALNKKIRVYKVFEKKLLFLLKKGKKTIWLEKALTSRTNPVGARIAKDKDLTKEFLKKLGYPVALSKVVTNISELKNIVKKIGFPLVIKPASASGGEGITINIKNKKILIDSFNIAKKVDKKVLVEKHISGDYFRITYIANGAYAATKNLPAYIIGDGRKTARQIISGENKSNKERYLAGRLNKIKISNKTERFLASEGFTLESIIPKNKKIPLCFSGYDGGEYIDVTEEIHPYFLRLARDVSNNLGLPIVGIDIIAKNIKKTLNGGNGVVIEINGTFPIIQFHAEPTVGKSRNLAPELISYLFNKTN